MGFITFKENAYGYFSQTGATPEATALEMKMRPVFGGLFTTVGGDVNEAISVPGLLTTDVVLVQENTLGAGPTYVRSAVAASNQINVVMGVDPSNDHILQYLCFRSF
jgi:hypothetical protein